MKDEEKIISYYNQGIENNRLYEEEGHLERIRTQDIILRYLPNETQQILDIGAGVGVYAFWLQKLGHNVRALDLSPENVKEMKKRCKENHINLQSIQVGNALDLPFEENSIDIVLLLGPLYHITEEKLRIQAINEVLKVLKPGGRAFFAAISNFAPLLHGYFLDKSQLNDSEYLNIVNQDLIDGQHRNLTNKPYFTTAYMHTYEQLKKEIDATEFQEIEIYAVESFGWLVNNVENIIKTQEKYNLLLSYIKKLEKEFSLIGITAHYLATGIKKN